MRFFICLIIAISLIASLTAACAKPGRAVGMNEFFTLKRGESVNISGTPINIKMIENGVWQRTSGGDSVFCKIEVKYKGNAEEKTMEAGDFIAYDEFNIRVEKVNTAVDVSKTSCVFVVAKTLG